MKANASGRLLTTIFVDYDNIYLSLKRKSEDAAKLFAKNAQTWLKEIESGRLITSTNGPAVDQPRRVVMSRCYGNPVPRRNASDNSTDMNSFPFVRHNFLRAGFEVIDCPPLTAQLKNSSDIRMVMDVRDLLNHDTYFDEFVILSGDADFTPVLQRLRAHARRTVIFANDYTATPYTAISDGEIREADLIALLVEGRLPGEQPAAIDAPASTPALPSANELEAMRKDILAEVAAVVGATSHPVPLEALADRAIRSLGHERTVGSAWGGIGSFRELVQRSLPPTMKLSDQPPYYVYNLTRQLPREPQIAREAEARPAAPAQAPAAARPDLARPEAAHAEPQRAEAPRLEAPRLDAPRGQPLRAEPVEPRYEQRPALAIDPLPMQSPMHAIPAAAQQPHAPAYRDPQPLTAAPAAPAPAPAPLAASAAPQAPRLSPRNPLAERLAAEPSAPQMPMAAAMTAASPASQAPALNPAPAMPRVPASQSAQPAPRAADGASAIQQSVARIHEACQAPPLSPPEYRALFDVMAQEITTNGLTGAQTLTNIMHRAQELGVEIRRDDVRFVLEVVSEQDPWFEQGATANLFANRFRNFVVARCRGQGLTLSSDELDLIDAWFAVAAAAARAPAQRSAAPMPAQQQIPAQPAPAAQQAPAPGERWWSLDEGRPATGDARYGSPDAGDDYPRILRTRRG